MLTLYITKTNFMSILFTAPAGICDDVNSMLAALYMNTVIHILNTHVHKYTHRHIIE